MEGLFGFGALGDALSATSENPIMENKPAQIRNTADERLVDNREALSRGGVTVRLTGVKFNFQLHPIHVTSPNTRYDFAFLTQNYHDRVAGFMIASNQFVENELRSNANHGTVELTINNEEIIPPNTPSSLFTTKLTNSFYDNMYVFNEKAGGSQVRGCFTSGNAATMPADGSGYDVMLMLYCIKN